MRAHAVPYSALDADTPLNLYDRSWSSPLVGCCGSISRSLWSTQKLLMRGFCGFCCRAPRRSGIGCCGCGARRRRAASTAGGRVLHPDSEGEPDEGRGCQADCIAWREDLRVIPLSQSECRAAAQVEPTLLLNADEATSDVSELDRKEHGYNARLCRYHTMQYQTRQVRTKCVRAGCRQAVAGEYEGMRFARSTSPCSPTPGGLRKEQLRRLTEARLGLRPFPPGGHRVSPAGNW